MVFFNHAIKGNHNFNRHAHLLDNVQHTHKYFHERVCTKWANRGMHMRTAYLWLELSPRFIMCCVCSQYAGAANKVNKDEGLPVQLTTKNQPKNPRCARCMRHAFCTHMQTRPYVCHTRTHTHAHTRAHTHTHIHTHTHSHTRTRQPQQRRSWESETQSTPRRQR